MTSPSLAVYSPAGYLLFDSGRNLVAQPFDPDGLELSGDPVPIGGPLARKLQISGFRGLSVSRTGVLAFQAGATARVGRLALLDRSGREIATIAEGGYYAPRLSRDGARLAVTMWDPSTTKGDIWIFDLARRAGSRFTFNPADDANCVWSPDGQHLIFGSSREGAVNLYMARTDRAGSEEPLLRSDSFKTPDSVSSDGRFLLYEMAEPGGSGQVALWSLPLSGDKRPQRFSAGASSIASAQFSPNGRWVAYQSVESGREEVYVAAFPGPGGKWQVSANGGRAPCWSADGRELFFHGADETLMSAEVTTDPAFEARAPRPLFKVHLFGGPDRQFDVAPDGKRFVANLVAGAGGAPPATIVLDWTAGLDKR